MPRSSNASWMLVTREPPSSTTAEPMSGSERSHLSGGDRDTVRGNRGGAGRAAISIRVPNVYPQRALPPHRHLAVGSNDRSSVPGDWYCWSEEQKRRGQGATVRLTPSARVPSMVGRATPSFWSPFLRVGARTLRTEQCAKSQCVYPVDLGRCGSPYLPARRSYGNCTTGRPIRVCCSGRPTFQQRTRNRPSRPGQRFFLRRV